MQYDSEWQPALGGPPYSTLRGLLNSVVCTMHSFPHHLINSVHVTLLCLCSILPPNPSSCSNHVKNIRQTQIERQFMRYKPVLFKLSRSWKTRGKWRNCHRPEEIKKIWQLNAMWCLRWNSGTEETPEWETQIKSGNLGISNAPLFWQKCHGYVRC